MAHIISIQPGQPGRGMDYDVRLPLPYPFHINVKTGDCTHGRGTADLGEAAVNAPWQLLGFQRGRRQELVLTLAEFAADPQQAMGLVPVFVDASGIFALTEPITNVTDHRTPPPVDEQDQQDEVGEGDDDFGCERHESLDGAHMGEAVYCDSSCRPRSVTR